MSDSKSRDYDTRIKSLVPGIINSREKEKMPALDSHQSQLKNEELFYRVLER